MKASKKLAALWQQELPALQKNLIIRDGDRIIAFGKYNISPTAQGFIVEDHYNVYGIFETTRTALAWCIADKFNNLNLARSIKQLDAIVTRYHNDIHTRMSQAQTTKSGSNWETIVSKLGHTRSQCQSAEHELTKCINRAKYLQIRGFSNETIRTGRTA